MIQVRSKPVSLDFLFKVSIGGDKQTHIYLDRFL